MPVALALWCLAPGVVAQVLPDDRADAMYHYYSGGGVDVEGVAFLVRKGVADTVSVSAGYYQDTISGASPDVLATASPYSERRDEYRLGVDYLYGDSILTLEWTRSEEIDYDGNTVSLGIAHEIFGGMTTVSLGYAHGSDVVSHRDTDFEEDLDRRTYRLGISQVLTPTLLLNLDYEGISESGFLGNPYRSKRMLGVFAGPEIYPGTRTSNAVRLQGVKYLHHGASAQLAYRYYRDTWSIDAHTVEAQYSRYFADRRWLLDLTYRYYSQSAASFFSDDFDREYTYMARDKEVSGFTSNSVGARVSYRLFDRPGALLNSGRAILAYDYVAFDYDDYSDASRSGNDPYSFGAHIMSVSVSLWY